MLDVAIIGGGPAGLLTAAHLAQSGLDVGVFEEDSQIGEPAHCTGIVSLETAELAKIPDDIVLGRLIRARLKGPGTSAAEFTWPGDAETILVVDRAAFDRSLQARALAAGALVFTSARVLQIESARHAVRLDTKLGPVQARACVLACGVSYRFQRNLGLGLPGQVIHTAQTEVDADPAETVEMHFGRRVAPEGFLWTVPIVREGQARLKIGVMARGDAGLYLKTFLERPTVRTYLRAAPSPPMRRLLPVRPLPKTFGERLLVVGDAGGFTKPTTGGGIFYSLLTATLAAETLVEGFHAGRLDEAFLERYETRWQERLGQELRVADWLRGIVGGCSDAEIDTLIRALGSNDVQALIRHTARFNWHRDVILMMVRQPGIKSLLVRALFR